MQEHTLAAPYGRTVVIDLCEPCQAFWFDGRESLQLSPGATLTLFRLIGERVARPALRDGDLSKCPRCRAGLRRVQDRQRSTRFEYFKCPHEHGRFIAFLEFLREKDFIRPLTAAQIAALGASLQTINCSNCGAAVDLARGGGCGHCGSPLSMLDLAQAERLVAQLRDADRGGQPVDPALPLALMRARREAEAAFAGLPGEFTLMAELPAAGLVAYGLQALARLLKAPPG